ncbi:MAG: hypothetical protein Q8N77_02250 [Nanoarchaeota archaeon]|nr:hypothetical protein [Nanoarchaeota archaeon]
MRLRNLFKPKLLEARLTEPDKLKEGLVYAIRHDKGSSIFLYVDGQNDILLSERWHTVSSLCVHNNWLYDGGYKIENHGFLSELNLILGFVMDTITGKDVMERENNTVYSLCSHNGVLYRGSYDSIFEVSTGRKIADRLGQVTAMCSHEGVLYDCGTDLYYDNMIHREGVYDTFKPKIVHKKYQTKTLCSHKGTLYGLGWDQYAKPFGRWFLFDILKNKKISGISEKRHVTTMCSYKEELYKGGYDGVYNTSGRIVISKGHITAMCSIPAELAEQIKHSYNHGFNFGDVQHINPRGFIEYLNINTKEEREKIISQLFNCENINKEVLKWLNEHEEDTMRKAAFSG